MCVIFTQILPTVSNMRKGKYRTFNSSEYTWNCKLISFVPTYINIITVSVLLFAYWVILHAFLSSVDFFLKSTFSKKSFRNTIRVSNSLDPDQARHFVGPDLDPNCLQRLSADDTSRQIQLHSDLSLCCFNTICSTQCLFKIVKRS